MDYLTFPHELSWAFFGNATTLHKLVWVPPDGQEPYLSGSTPLAENAKSLCGMRGDFRAVGPWEREHGHRCARCSDAVYPRMPWGQGIPVGA